MNTEEFKKYLINYYKEKKRLRLYRVFKEQYERQSYSRRRRITKDK